MMDCQDKVAGIQETFDLTTAEVALDRKTNWTFCSPPIVSLRHVSSVPPMPPSPENSLDLVPVDTVLRGYLSSSRR